MLLVSIHPVTVTLTSNLLALKTVGVHEHAGANNLGKYCALCLNLKVSFDMQV